MSKRLLTFLLTTLVSMSGYALEFDSPKIIEVPVTKQSGINNRHDGARPTVSVGIMRLKLTPDERKKFRSYSLNRSSQPPQVKVESSLSHPLPSAINVGMNGVPVLNQGEYGSCVTFAVTAALDALLGKGDYISQLCALQLGSYLAKHSYNFSSGWNGSTGPDVLHLLLQYGIVSAENQTVRSCGGITTYPTKSQDIVSGSMSLEEYKNISENISRKISWYPILTIQERMEWDEDNTEEAQKILLRVKKILASRSPSRITFAAQLFGACNPMGTCGRYHEDSDTWVVTPEILNEAETSLYFGGHQMVLTGYNDKAIVKDKNGKRHQGILIIRNSWGDTGDHGEYYMTYDYFLRYIWAVEVISRFYYEY